TNYGTESGLASRQVTDFLEARNGFYWVATARGLCRFIPDGWSQKASVGAGGAWERFFVYYPGEGRARIINAIFEDHEGTIWCCTDQGLYRVDPARGNPAISPADIIEPSRDASAPTQSVAVTEDRRGSLWIVAGSGLYRLRPDRSVERYTAEEGVPEGYPYVLLEDRDGVMWLASRFGLCQLVSDPRPHRSLIARRYTVRDGLKGEDVSSMCQSSDGTLWIGTWTTVSRFSRGQNGEGPRVQSYTRANGIPGATALCEDRDHNLWIGTDSGALRLAASGFVTYDEADGLGGTHPGATRVASIFEDQAR